MANRLNGRNGTSGSVSTTAKASRSTTLAMTVEVYSIGLLWQRCSCPMEILGLPIHARLHSTLGTMELGSTPTTCNWDVIAWVRSNALKNVRETTNREPTGTIKYFDAWHNDSSGNPVKMPNVVCCHEQDDGILWKHTKFRTQDAVVARSRILVLQTIITVSNYEYIFAFHFGQDASIHYEVRATGVLSTVPTSLDSDQKLPYGTNVAPGVLAPYHQHLFSLRIDPALDGHNNTLAIEESHPLPIDDPTVHNPFGVGYTTTTTPVLHESGHDLDHTTNRTFKILNESSLNPTTKTPVGFKLLPFYSQNLLSHPSSYHARRSEFAQHAVWVTKYQDYDHFPAGKYTMQSLGGEGIASAIAKRAANAVVDNRPSPPENQQQQQQQQNGIRDADIVVWHTFGSTHNPRIEDWPVMPAEKMTVGLKPVNFFSGNPGLDVRASRPGEGDGRSVWYTGAEGDGCCGGGGGGGAKL